MGNASMEGFRQRVCENLGELSIQQCSTCHIRLLPYLRGVEIVLMCGVVSQKMTIAASKLGDFGSI